MDEAPVELVEFCAREWSRLVGSLTLYLGDAAVAEEIAQETLARVARDWSRVRHLESPGGWSHRVAMNLAVSQKRREGAAQRAAVRLAGSRSAPTESDPADAMAVRAAVAALP